jgi:hypothetical protein
MNSSRDGRINSAIIPLFGDFDFLQTWQTNGAVLIGIRCRIKPLLHGLSMPCEGKESWAVVHEKTLSLARRSE